MCEIVAVNGDDGAVWYYQLVQDNVGMYLYKTGKQSWSGGRVRHIEKLDPDTIIQRNVPHRQRGSSFVILPKEQLKLRLKRASMLKLHDAPVPYVWAFHHDGGIFYGELWVSELGLDLNSEELFYKSLNKPLEPLISTEAVTNWDAWMVAVDEVHFRRQMNRPLGETRFIPFSIRKDNRFFQVFVRQLQPTENRTEFLPSQSFLTVAESEALRMTECTQENGIYSISEVEQTYQYQELIRRSNKAFN